MEDAAQGLIAGEDGKLRPAWAYGDTLLTRYYDTEWGMPVHGESEILERLCLEGFQSGLSWLTVLKKRPAMREVFHGFQADRLVHFTDDVERLMGDKRIIRNRRKIEAVVTNARATITLRSSGGLDKLVWSFKPRENFIPLTPQDIPSSTDESRALSKALKSLGFSFVGPTTCWALMQAIGIVDAHQCGSWRRGSSGVWPM